MRLGRRVHPRVPADASHRGRRLRRRGLGPSVAPSSTPRPAGLIIYTAERQRHAQFVGRAVLLAEFDRLLIADCADRLVVVTGGPGMGKSAVLAEWLARREAAGDAVPHHFIRRGWDDWDDPAKLVG